MKQENSLKHYGVPGMKWGVRKGQNGSARRNAKKAMRELQRTNKARVKRTKASKLTDAELRDKVNRMNLEKQYKNLKKGTGSKILKEVGSIPKDAVKEVIKEQIKRGAQYGYDKAEGKVKKQYKKRKQGR